MFKLKTLGQEETTWIMHEIEPLPKLEVIRNVTRVLENDISFFVLKADFPFEIMKQDVEFISFSKVRAPR